LRRKLVLAVLLVTVATLAAPAVEQTDEATFAAQATQKAKNKWASPGKTDTLKWGR